MRGDIFNPNLLPDLEDLTYQVNRNLGLEALEQHIEGAILSIHQQHLTTVVSR